MSGLNSVFVAEQEVVEPFEDRIDTLFNELELATRWQRPSLLLAIYSSEYVRSDADNALENRLQILGQSAYHIKVKNQDDADISSLISELANLENVVFFVEGLRWGTALEDGYSYRFLSKSREFFIENQVRVVFWLTENEAVDLAHYAPDYWSFRHRVIEFVDSPTPQQIPAHILESVWQGTGEFTNSIEDLDAKIAMRTSMLSDLPSGDESTAARSNLLLTLGVLHWRRGDYEQACQFLNAALDQSAMLEDDRFEALCFNALALVQTDLGRHEDAIKAYQNAVCLAPGRICPWNNLGKLYRKLDRHTEALDAYQKAVEQDPSDVIGWKGLGELHHQFGRNHEAIDAFLNAIELSPNFSPTWSNLGDVYLAEGQIKEALAAHQKAIQLDRRNAASWLGLGRIFKQQGKHGNARTAFETSIESDPRNVQAWHELGDLAYNSGANDEAMHSYRKVLEFDQASLPVYQNLTALLLGDG